MNRKSYLSKLGLHEQEKLSKHSIDYRKSIFEKPCTEMKWFSEMVRYIVYLTSSRKSFNSTSERFHLQLQYFKDDRRQIRVMNLSKKRIILFEEKETT